MKKNVVIGIFALLIVVLTGISIKSYGDKQAIYPFNKEQLQRELATALDDLSIDDERSYNDAMTHFYGAYMIVQNSSYFPSESKRVEVFGFLWNYGSNFPDAFKARIPELLQLKEDVIALNTKDSGEKDFRTQLMDLYDKLYDIVVEISDDF